MKHILLCFLVVILLIVSICIGAMQVKSPVVTLEVLRQKQYSTPEEVKAMIPRVASLMKFREEPLMFLAEHESSFRPLVMGDHNKAYHTFQYHLPTWNSYIKKYGLEYMNLKITNPADQTILTVYALRDNQHLAWSPYSTIKNAPR